MHAIGDAVNRGADASSHPALAASPAAAHRARAAADPGDLARFAGLGVTASMQPSHAPSDRAVAEAAWGSRCSGAYALGSLAASGAVLCFGSDAPIEPLDPLAGVQAAVTRDWPAAEALAVEAALEGYWGGAAHARQAERRLGRLLPGYVADLVVLERDPVACPPDEISAIDVVATMVGGRWHAARRDVLLAAARDAAARHGSRASRARQQDDQAERPNARPAACSLGSGETPFWAAVSTAFGTVRAARTCECRADAGAELTRGGDGARVAPRGPGRRRARRGTAPDSPHAEA